jgi:formyl transferase-like protein
MRTVLICHAQAPLDRYGLARWLASFSELAGVIVLREKKQRMWRRIRREIRRTGPLRFLDVLGFRAYYKIFHSRSDARWEQAELAKLCQCFPDISPNSRVLFTHSPNSPEAESFLRDARPDMVIARCKTLLKERIFRIPSAGTFVFHPGICPEYRNAHGCFWALANGDLKNVGMTLLQIDSGVDTGPIYGHFSYGYDEVRESHHVIQQRAVFENLDKLQARLLDIYAKRVAALDVRGRSSQTWGQPWLSRYVVWKLEARQRQRNAGHLNSISRRGE